jgi:hypothetical protein
MPTPLIPPDDQPTPRDELAAARRWQWPSEMVAELAPSPLLYVEERFAENAGEDPEEDPDDGDYLDFGPRVQDESWLAPAQANSLRSPLLHILRNGGRSWSAEVELNGLSYSHAARVLKTAVAGYRERSDQRGSVVSTPDCTVDAEVKLSRMRDGNATHAKTCVNAYHALRGADAVAGYNCGHHVHVDASRLAEMDYYKAQEVVQAAAFVGAACDKTLTALAASGYAHHRMYEDNDYGAPGWAFSEVLNDRFAIHGSTISHAISYGTPGSATVEYRLPNGTLEPIRAHAHIAIAVGLLDLAERAILDLDAEALKLVDRARSSVESVIDNYAWQPGGDEGAGFDEVQGAGILAKALRLHQDSYRALAAACASAPAHPQHKAIWTTAAKSLARV